MPKNPLNPDTFKVVVEKILAEGDDFLPLFQRIRDLEVELSGLKRTLEEKLKSSVGEFRGEMSAPGVVSEPSATKESASSTKARPPRGARIKVKDVVLTAMREVFHDGVRSAQLRKYLMESHSLDVHEKTAGMTLYRLSRDGLVHRVGQVWFFGPQAEPSLPASSENPGAGTPGHTHEAEAGKEEA